MLERASRFAGLLDIEVAVGQAPWFHAAGSHLGLRHALILVLNAGIENCDRTGCSMTYAIVIFALDVQTCRKRPVKLCGFS